MGIDGASAGSPLAGIIVVVDRQDERGRGHGGGIDAGEVEADELASMNRLPRVAPIPDRIRMSCFWRLSPPVPA